MAVPKGKELIKLNGVSIVYNPDLVLRRVTQSNTLKSGGMFLRYAKNKALSQAAAEHQSAFAFVNLRDHPVEETAKPEKKLCIAVRCSSPASLPGA